MILLPSHSTSVKSVTSNGGNSASVCGEYEPNRGNTAGWYYDTFTKSGLGYSLCWGCVANTAVELKSKPSGWMTFVVLQPVTVILIANKKSKNGVHYNEQRTYKAWRYVLR